MHDLIDPIVVQHLAAHPAQAAAAAGESCFPHNWHSRVALIRYSWVGEGMGLIQDIIK